MNLPKLFRALSDLSLTILLACVKSVFLKSFEFFFCFFVFITKQNYVNTELDKTKLLMNLKNRMLSTEIEYYQENMEYYKKKSKGITKHCRYFQN